MFDQLHAQLATASFTSTNQKEQAKGAVGNALAGVVACGANLGTADVGRATTFAGAVGCARAAVVAQSFSSVEAKQRALGVLDQLGARLASVGLT